MTLGALLGSESHYMLKTAYDSFSASRRCDELRKNPGASAGAAFKPAERYSPYCPTLLLRLAKQFNGRLYVTIGHDKNNFVSAVSSVPVRRSFACQDQDDETDKIHPHVFLG